MIQSHSLKQSKILSDHVMIFHNVTVLYYDLKLSFDLRIVKKVVKVCAINRTVNILVKPYDEVVIVTALNDDCELMKFVEVDSMGFCNGCDDVILIESDFVNSDIVNNQFDFSSNLIPV